MIFPTFIGRENGAKVLYIYELCKFFTIKSFQQPYKVIQNKNASYLLVSTCIFEIVKKFSKIKKLSTTYVFYL